MIQTKITRTLTLAGVVPAGKLSHSYRSLLPVLALCVATAAWSQTTFGLSGRSPMRGKSGMVRLATPAAATPASAQYQFINIEIQGSTGADAFNINDGRLVTGDYFDASGNGHGFLWRDGSVQTLDHPSSLDTLPSATNNLGVGIGVYGDSTTGRAATYSLASGAWITLPDISGMPVNYGDNINDLGVAVGIAGSGGLPFDYTCTVAWIWDPFKSAYSFFSAPGAANGSTCANGINDLGQVAGGYYDASGMVHGFLKDGESYTTFEVPGAGAGGTGANQINNKGEIAGGWYDASGYLHGYVRSAAGQFTIVDVPGTSGSAVYGINDRGDICGTWLDSSGVAHAYVALKR